MERRTASVRLPTRLYSLALLCYLAIPVVVIASGTVASLIDPEWAVRTGNYALNFKLLEFAKAGVVLAGMGLVLALWIACCWLVLKSRERSLGWLAFAVAGSLGFSVIAALKDRAPGPNDAYQHFVGGLNTVLRVALEVMLFFSIWVLAYQAMVVKRGLMIRLQAAVTGRSVDDIVAEQLASSGMWAAAEGMEVLYLVPLLYLLWPLAFNLVGRLFRSRPV